MKKVTDDKHIHDSKSLPELVNGIMGKKQLVNYFLMVVLTIATLFLEIWKTMESFPILK